ncbi:DUF502 domain-containing protein [Effusibacillus lacus]|uniref:DUF502 domain-containing protein n=1 Tax=Effusibacillus lacus TaxID=1348429 RepID=A0A292YSV5_9BACL|nr:DUF502 domain-containing protein [Effusibacillus lacus]TCS74885.1 putative membrane protein [Effusibacillus lacus]GAX91560.1 hypothetical protein EFBL_3250 [Effusibacillus lacus]
MKSVVKYFANGIITITPIALVIYVVIQVFYFLDNLLGRFLKNQDSGFEYIPGSGLLLSIVLITLVGWLATQYVSRTLLNRFERLIARIPIVKSLYSIIKETIESFFGEKRSFAKVALVRIPDTSMRMMGFVTSEDMDKLSDQLSGHIAVYLPQSFQVAGFTVLVPKEDVEILDISAEDAMRFILSAGVSGQNGSRGTVNFSK